MDKEIHVKKALCFAGSRRGLVLLRTRDLPCARLVSLTALLR